MATMLVTEALQQIKIITDRLLKKREFIKKYVVSNSRFIDPLKKSGGSETVIASEMQSISDLENNLVAIRTAIQKKNLEASLTVDNKTRTVAEWLIWRREISGGASSFLYGLSDVIQKQRAAFEKEVKTASAATAEGQTVKESNLLVYVDEKALASDYESLGVILGTLDSRLSVFNATTSIDVEI